MTCQQWGCKQINHHHPPAGQVANNQHVPSKYHSGTTHRPIPQAHILSSPPPSAVNGNLSTATGEIKQMLHDMKSEIRSDMQSLTTHMEKLEASPSSKLPPSSGVSGSSSGDILNDAANTVLSQSAITVVPNHLEILDLHLANKNILWTRVTSAGIPLPLPIDSCCSFSLVSKAHSDVIGKVHPTLKFTKLSPPPPLSVSAANPQAQLRAIDSLQVPVIWDNGRASVCSMLVVLQLAWLILFGQNHLRMIQAYTDHTGPKVCFDHPALNFTITCCDENPLKVFPSLINQNSSQPAGTTSYSTVPTTVCLLTSMPLPSQPRELVTLHRGFNVVSFCLLLATSLVGTSLLATRIWLESQEICPGLQVISGPIDLNTVPSSYSLDTPQGSGILVSQNLTSFSEMPILCETFYTAVVIQSTKDKVSLPFNANLCFIQPKTPENEQVFHDADNHTADQLASTWLYFAESVTANDSNSFSSQ